MWKAIKERPVVAFVISILIGVPAFITVLGGLAAIWVVMSRDTVPEFLAKKGWVIALPAWQAIVAIVLGAAILGLQIAILRKAYDAQPQQTAGAVLPSYPTVMFFTHDSALTSNPTLALEVRDAFEKAGWLMEIGRTNVARHADGVWIHGGASFEREMAKWGMRALGIEARVDYTNDNPPSLQIIVGAYTKPLDVEARDSKANELVIEQQKDEIRQLRTVLQQTLEDREAIRGALHAETIQARNERDSFERAWLTCKRQFGIQRLVWFVQGVERNLQAHNASVREEEKVEVCVTIRFVGYSSGDFGLAKKIETILKQHTKWKINMDGSNNPALIPSNEFKVIFESAISGGFHELASAFAEGQLIDAVVGQRANGNRYDFTDLVIEVLPTADA
jgi:hypothetical protein